MLILKNMKHALIQLSRAIGVYGLYSLAFSLIVGNCFHTSLAESLEPLPELPQAQATAADGQYTLGVKAYREGDYIQARRTFYALHKQHPENTKATYYLAITEAQLGRFLNAKKLYQEIISLDPQGETAQMALEGLKYLPAESKLDLPPRFNVQAVEPPLSQKSTSMPQTAPNPAQDAATFFNKSGANAMPQGMSQQDWMAWQTLMGQTGTGAGNMGNNNSGFNMMPWMMQPSATPNGSNGMSSYDPNVMSNMMMNQMLQNFSLEGNKDDNR